MKKHPRAAAGLTALALGALALLGVAGCTRCGGTSDAEHVYFPGNGTCLTLGETTQRAEYALLPFYAALAASVYNTDPATGAPTGKRVGSIREFCDDKSSFYLPPWLELLDPSLHPPLGEPAHGRDIGRLNYNVFAQRRAGENTRVFLVFRGTDDAGDWFANLRWFTRAMPGISDEYDQLQRILVDLARVVHEQYGGNATITTVGHSLGGGLAQMAAYGFPWDTQSSNIGAVYVFDSSPVTGFYSVKELLRERNSAGLSIHRVYDHGEILAYARLLMKLLYPVSEADPAIVEARFNLLRGNVVAQHGMHSFACNIWKAYGMKEPQAP